ncbi:MAG: hypothetical protein ACFB15_30265 [Cyclobacteriaceae bacterium]
MTKSNLPLLQRRKFITGLVKAAGASVLLSSPLVSGATQQHTKEV